MRPARFGPGINAALWLLCGTAAAQTPMTGRSLLQFSQSQTAYLSAVNTLNSLAGATIPNGGSAMLTWDSSSAASCAGTGFSTGGAVSGSVTVSPTTTTAYSVTCGGASAAATVSVSGTLRNPAGDGTCTANGGGTGSSGSPWRYNCIQAAVNASTAGDTIKLAGGNWRLDTADAAFVAIDKAITLVGAGSGNTFDAYGHINNASGTTQCPTAGTSITCVYQTGPSHASNPTPVPPGIIVFGQVNCVSPFACPVQAFSDTNCANVTVTHIFFDGSVTTAGGNYAGLLSFNNCAGPVTLADIRFLTVNLSVGSETQLYASGTQDIVIRDSMLGNPQVAGSYQWGQAFESVLDRRETLINNVFWQGTYNPTNNESVVFSGNDTEAALINAAQNQSAIGPTGCGAGAPCSTNSGTNGTPHITASNNYNNGGSGLFALGGGINDPSTNGVIRDLHFTGNWFYGADVALDACIWHLASVQGNCNGGGMSINALPNSACTAFSSSGDPYINTNNSLISTATAHLNPTNGAGTMPCTTSVGGTVNVALQVFNYTAQQNYLSGPGNQYNTGGSCTNCGSNTFNVTVTANFCSGSTFTQTDSSTCATTGFTTPPTAGFTLGTLSNGVVQFAATAFTAQYGAVQWLASTSSSVPTPSDARWSYLPPVSLAVSHGSAVYLWVMDSACVTAPSTCTASQHISAAAAMPIP
jgi:hypothetical protein